MNSELKVLELYSIGSPIFFVLKTVFATSFLQSHRISHHITVRDITSTPACVSACLPTGNPVPVSSANNK